MSRHKNPSGSSEKISKEQYNLYKNLVENTRELIQTISPEGRFLFVNNAWRGTLGYSQEEIAGLSLNDIIHPDSKNHCMTLLSSILAVNDSSFFETCLVTKEGLKIFVEGSIHRICKKGKVVYVQCIMRDVSERKTYCDTIEHAINEWRITFDSMPCGVLLLDLDCRIKRANRYFASLYNLSLKDINGCRCEEILKNKTLNKIFRRFTEQRMFPLKSEEYYDPVLNRSFILDLTPIPDKDGLTRSLVLTLADVSEIKLRGKKLEESRDAFFNMLKDLDYSYKELKGLFDGLIRSFINVIEAKSLWTKGHSERVTNYSLLIAKEIGLNEDETQKLTVAALLHDIGKIGTYDLVLDNPNRLTAEELRLIYMHPVKGEEILKPIKQMKKILPIIRHHHERIDGKGYPDGLIGEDIPLLARIICVADAFDSMTSNRPYRNASTWEYAVSELKSCRGTQFDRRVVDVFLRVLNKTGETRPAALHTNC